jgi:hypothetical protein
MHTARIPPVDPAPATITAVLAMHTGHICPSSERLIRPRLSAWWSCTNTNAGIERPGSDKCGGIPMDSPITAAARALVKTTDAIHRYCWLADHGHAEQIADLFAQGARLVFGEGAPKPGTLTGPEIAAAIRAIHNEAAPSNAILTLFCRSRWATTRSETQLRGDCRRNTASSSIVHNDKARCPSRD